MTSTRISRKRRIELARKYIDFAVNYDKFAELYPNTLNCYHAKIYAKKWIAMAKTILIGDLLNV